jgi:class 3 adenylate cyclase
LGERVPAAVFVRWRGRSLYVHAVFLLGQIMINAPAFATGILFLSLVTQVAWADFVVPVGIGHVGVTILGGWFYLRFSRAIRRFLAGLWAGGPLDTDLATAAWLEAIVFPQRVVGWTIVPFLIVYGLLVVLFSVPRFGPLPALEGGVVALTVGVWFGLVLFLFYLEWTLRPVARLALAAGASPALDNLGLARLRLGVKLQVLTLALIGVPAVTVGLFAYSQVVALGGDPAKVLRVIGLAVAVASGAAIVQAFLLVRSVIAPVRELQRVIDEVSQGNLQARARLLTTDELAELGLHFNHMVEDLRRQEPLKAAFGQYVSEAVRDGILSGQISLGGERREITILFTDIRDFTGWCEQEEPETVIQTLNVYYGFLVQALIRHGGTITRYTGDGVLALFGAPLEDPDHALHAVLAAWEAHNLLEKFNDIRRTVGAFELRTGFGVHTGMAAVGSIGCEARAEYTPIGDAANVASRIEGLNRELGTVILISDDTYRRVADRLIVGKRAATPVKGRSQPVEVVEVAGLRSDLSQEIE